VCDACRGGTAPRQGLGGANSGSGGAPLEGSTFVFAQAILSEAGLSFLGVGTPPEIPSWGNMLGEARAYLASAPWTMLAPGAALMVAVLGLNLLGDGIRDLLDPRLRRL